LERRLETPRFVEGLDSAASIGRIVVDLGDERVDVRRISRSLGAHECVSESQQEARRGVGPRERDGAIQVRIAQNAIPDSNAGFDGDEDA
jgi:hypothetical protein